MVDSLDTIKMKYDCRMKGWTAGLVNSGGLQRECVSDLKNDSSSICLNHKYLNSFFGQGWWILKQGKGTFKASPIYLKNALYKDTFDDQINAAFFFFFP